MDFFSLKHVGGILKFNLENNLTNSLVFGECDIDTFLQTKFTNSQNPKESPVPALSTENLENNFFSESFCKNDLISMDIVDSSPLNSPQSLLNSELEHQLLLETEILKKKFTDFGEELLGFQIESDELPESDELLESAELLESDELLKSESESSSMYVFLIFFTSK